MALSKEDRAEVESITKPIADSVAKLTETIGALPTADKVGEAIKAQVEAATKPITEAIAKIGEAKPGDDKNKDGKKGEDAEPPAWFKKYQDEHQKLAEGLGTITAERTEAQQLAASKTLVEQTLNELKLGGLLKRPSLVAKLVAAKPKDKAAVQALVEQEKKYAQELGVDVKAFSASAADEGGKAGEGGNGREQDSEAEAKRILETKTERL